MVQSEYEPEFAWIPVLVVLGLATIAALAVYGSGRRRKAARGEGREVADAVAIVLEDTLDDLWELVRHERPPPEDRLARGLSPSELGRVVESLEQI